MTSEFYKVV